MSKERDVGRIMGQKEDMLKKCGKKRSSGCHSKKINGDCSFGRRVPLSMNHKEPSPPPCFAAIAASPPSPLRRLTICVAVTFLMARQLPCPLPNRGKTCHRTICASVAFLMTRQLPCPPPPNREKTCPSSRQIN